MDTSFELLSSMSPKINKHYKPPRKAPTILALRKSLRKSLSIKNSIGARLDESVISISSTSSSSKESKVTTPIVISESEDSCQEKTPPVKTVEMADTSNFTPVIEKSLSKEKIKTIQHWVDNVNSAKHDLTGFSELSSVFGDDNPGFRRPKTNMAVSSSILDSNDKRFDEFFKKKGVEECEESSSSLEQDRNNEEVIDDSLKVVEQGLKSVSISKDSFKITVDEDIKLSIHSKQKCEDSESPKQQTFQNPADFEDLLDSLYGDSWREKKNDILPTSAPKNQSNQKNGTKTLPSSESKPRKNKEEVTKNVTQTERPVKTKSNDIESNLKTILDKARFRRALESPWVKSVQKICDSDTDSEPKNELPHVRLKFDDDDDDNSESTSPPPTINKKTKSKVSKKSKPINNKSTNKSYSFLSSLSASVPVDKCDYSALIFRNHYHQHKETLTTKLFKLYNEKVFNNGLPEDMKLEWNDRLRGTAGKCICKKITRRTGAIERTAVIMLSKKVLDSADRLRDTLIHELCHAATWIINQVADGHGAFWKSWASCAMKAFPELPPISRCHNYIINTKYSYKCTGCGYIIGRHTKSLDVERKRCGYCFGKFEVLINKTTKEGTKAVPVTPKKPNQFALFVKENYSSCKTPDMNHGDVMKILSQKFSDLKVQNVNK